MDTKERTEYESTITHEEFLKLLVLPGKKVLSINVWRGDDPDITITTVDDFEPSSEVQ